NPTRAPSSRIDNALRPSARTNSHATSRISRVGLLVCMIGFVGPADLMRNLAPWALFVTFWVGLVPASLLFGPVWRVLNPLRLVHAALAEMLRVDPEQGVYRLPEAVGYWPAAASLAGYGWFELVYPRHAQPIPTAVFLTLYAV